MTRTFSIYFFILLLASCGGGSGSGSTGIGSGANESTIEELTDAQIQTEEVPVEAQTFQVNAELSGFERDQEEKINKAIDLIKKVVASDSFKKMILKKKYKGKNQFVDNNGLSNGQIYAKILSASEKLNPGNNNSMDINLEGYYDNARVIGYTMRNIQTVFLNTKYLNKDNFEENEVAMNLMHEWLHKLGFGHAQKNSPSRPHSVPYAIGYIMRKLAATI